MIRSQIPFSSRAPRVNVFRAAATGWQHGCTDAPHAPLSSPINISSGAHFCYHSPLTLHPRKVPAGRPAPRQASVAGDSELPSERLS